MSFELFKAGDLILPAQSFALATLFCCSIPACPGGSSFSCCLLPEH